MYKWLQALTSGAAIVLPHFLSSTNTHTDHGLLPKEAIEWTESIRIKYDLPGINIGVIASPERTGDGWRNETYGLGYMDFEGKPIDGDTLFAMASNSKQFAAMSIGLLIHNETTLENGDKLDYSTKIKDILPDWRMVDPYMQDHLDVLDLLSMRSGMPRHDGATAEEDQSQIVARFQHLRPSTEIRQIMQYNNFHYFIIAEIVAHITKEPYPVYVKSHILDPVGMTSSTYNHTLASTTGHLSGSFVRADKNATRCAEMWAKHDKLDRSCYGQPFETSFFTKGNGLFIAGPGGLVSSAKDVMKWLKELLDPKVIPLSVISETHKVFIPAFGETVEYDEVGAENYGQGQVTFNYRGHEVIQHGGDVPGFSTQVTRLPALGVGFYVGINDDDVGALVKSTIVYRLLDAILGVEPIDWEERLVTTKLRQGLSFTPRPEHPRVAPKITSMLGQYINKGYGSLELISFKNPSHHAFLSKFADATESAAYLQAISKAMTTKAGLAEPYMFAQTGKLFGSVYVFSHFDGPIFNTTLLEAVQGSKGEWVAFGSESSAAVFEEGSGMGMFENFWGGKRHKRAVESQIEAEAEVWFSKKQ